MQDLQSTNLLRQLTQVLEKHHDVRADSDPLVQQHLLQQTNVEENQDSHVIER
ncbi:Uncharacterised protein [Arcanobacterium haemolyticum]|nr:Uncharacterised protein [Arcanobacterium haemolyticum]